MVPLTPTMTRQSFDNDHHGSINMISRTNNGGNISNNNNNNNNTSLKFGHNIPTLMSQTSLPLLDGHSTPTNQSLLAPPNMFSKERRHSTSSCDSSVSQSSRRRLRRNSSSRMSDYDDDKKDVTLLTFARAVKIIYKKVGSGVRKAVSMLFVSRQRRPNIVCEAEIMEQAVWIGADFVISKLSSKQLMNRKVGLTPSDWYKSVHVINACTALETMHPKVYSNVSRKLCMTMSSPKIVKSTLNALLDVLFEDSVSWGKIVSMFAVAGLFAEECASQGHADYVKEVVDVVVDFIGENLLAWLVSQGGWDAFPTPCNNDKNRLSKLRLLILTSALTAIAMSTTAFLDFM